MTPRRANTSCGDLNRENTASRDITAQYYDLRARLTNARRAEKQLLAIMEMRAKNLTEYPSATSFGAVLWNAGKRN